MEEKKLWLCETGYIARDFGVFEFIIRIDDYGARNAFGFWEIDDMPLETMKEIHADFIERAERKEIF